MEATLRYISFCRHVVVALKITEKLIAECSPQRLQLIVDSYLDMPHAMLESTRTDMQIMATNSVSSHNTASYPGLPPRLYLAAVEKSRATAVR